MFNSWQCFDYFHFYCDILTGSFDLIKYFLQRPMRECKNDNCVYKYKRSISMMVSFHGGFLKCVDLFSFIKYINIIYILYIYTIYCDFRMLVACFLFYSFEFHCSLYPGTSKSIRKW